MRRGLLNPVRHDWPFAAQSFAAALPWLAGRLGTPGVSRIPLPGLGPEAVSSAPTASAMGPLRTGGLPPTQRTR